MGKRKKTGGRVAGVPNKATAGVKEVLFAILDDATNGAMWEKWLLHKDPHLRWEAFKLAQSYMFGKPVQPVVGEELAPPIRIDISAIPRKRERA